MAFKKSNKINFYYWLVVIFLIIISIVLLTRCKPEKHEFRATPYNIEIPKFFPTHLNLPEDNPLTVEGIELGRNLFYDGRLSGRTHSDSLMSCASCHFQSKSFDCGIEQSKDKDGYPHGLNGEKTSHVVLPLVNLVWNTNGYLWNGAVYGSNPNVFSRNIEDIVVATVLDPYEINGDTSRTVNMIKSIKGYPEMFEKAFGTPDVSMERISKAIAQFVRTLVSSNSRFDKYLRGELQLTDSELSGYELFMTEEGADCFHCHGGSGNPLFTTNLFYNNGKDIVFTDPHDRFSVTNKSYDIGAYKATTLRNIEVTGPYMHDGRFKTIEDVINFYATGVKVTEYTNSLMHHAHNGGNQLTPFQRNNLIAFLKSLTDTTFINNKQQGPPSLLPDGAEPLPRK